MRSLVTPLGLSRYLPWSLLIGFATTAQFEWIWGPLFWGMNLKLPITTYLMVHYPFWWVVPWVLLLGFEMRRSRARRRLVAELRYCRLLGTGFHSLGPPPNPVLEEILEAAGKRGLIREVADRWGDSLEYRLWLDSLALKLRNQLLGWGWVWLHLNVSLLALLHPLSQLIG